MTPHDHDAPVDLTALQVELLEKARGSNARRAATTVFGGSDLALRQTMLALVAGSELGEHDSPPAATLQVLRGRVVLKGDGRQWELTTGQLVAIPPERHSVDATEDSVFLLTVLRAQPAAHG